jgi:multidrug efflux pump subunit AcrA (membrane-fusion protein)
MTVLLKCPQRSQVLGVYVSDGDMVTVGQRLISLDASEEEKYLARLEDREAVLRAHLNAISPGEITQRIRPLQLVVDNYSKQSDADNVAVDVNRNSYQAGTLLLATLLKSEASKIESQESLLQSQIALAQLEKDADISRYYLANALEIVSKEEQYAKRAIERLSIKAPIRGKISLYVNIHTPVKRGFILAELG